MRQEAGVVIVFGKHVKEPEVIAAATGVDGPVPRAWRSNVRPTVPERVVGHRGDGDQA